SSTDVFPIEFLDMKEKHVLLYGRDLLSGLEIDISNLRFQCEHELKSHLISMKRTYLHGQSAAIMRDALFRTFTSTLHILRNFLKLKGERREHPEGGVFADIAGEFEIDTSTFNKIAEAKEKNLRLTQKVTERLFSGFMTDLEHITRAIDRV
ncbi:MAG: hypothetical protein PHP46_04890, partial [Candidatus Omnitrophica bacterium]|nr:hypothetical protein [Candidatus Omnitrophota bacterium]